MLPRVVLLAGFLHHAYAFSIPHIPHLSDFVGASHAQKQQQPLQDSFDAWVEKEGRIALDKLLANVAPGGGNVQGKDIADGTVIASPSQDGPDYWFQCESQQFAFTTNLY
jgi:glucoamylase